MIVFVFAAFVLVGASTPSPLISILNGDSLDFMVSSRSDIQAHLARGDFQSALEMAERLIETTESEPIFSDVIAITQAFKGVLDQLRASSRQLSLDRSGMGPLSMQRQFIDSNLADTRQTIVSLCEQMWAFLHRLLNIARYSNVDEQVDYQLSAADYMRYYVEQLRPLDERHQWALHYYDSAIANSPHLDKALQAINSKALLLKLMHGEAVAAEFIKPEIENAEHHIARLLADDMISVDEGLYLYDIVGVMKHNLSIWGDPDEWVVV